MAKTEMNPRFPNRALSFNSMQQNLLPNGVWPVMLTPFLREKGPIDWPAYDHLVDFYLESGCHGLFATCGSSEAGFLETEETLELVRRAMARSGGRVPVVAGALCMGGLEPTVRLVRQLGDLGVAAAVVTPSLLVRPGTGEPILQNAIERLMAEAGDVPLGIYEWPKPYHRVLSPAFLGWVAGTGRFFFFKDTCCAIEPIREKIANTRGTPLKFFNANLATLLESLVCGADGYSGVGTNHFPEAYVKLLDLAQRDYPAAAALHRLLLEFDDRFNRGEAYPRSAKLLLAMRGLPIAPHCRLPADVPNPADVADLQQACKQFEEQFQLTGTTVQ